jgi:hypothetical protein
MELVFLGINVLIIMGFWHYVVKKTLLDNTRDKLFDLRDEIRDVYTESEWGIDGDVYGNLRYMINAYLRYTETYSVWSVVSVRGELARTRNTNLREHLVSRINANFKTPSTEQNIYIANVRSRASKALMQYSVYSSGLLLIAAFAMTPYFVVKTLFNQFSKGLSAFGTLVARDALHFGRMTSFIWALSTGWVASQFVDQQSIDVAIASDSHRFI